MKSAIQDQDMLHVERALLRAGRRARRIAAQTNTPVIVYENGRIMKKRCTASWNPAGEKLQENRGQKI